MSCNRIDIFVLLRILEVVTVQRGQVVVTVQWGQVVVMLQREQAGGGDGVAGAGRQL